VTTFAVLQAPLFGHTANPRVLSSAPPCSAISGPGRRQPTKNARHGRCPTRPAWARYAM